MLLGPDDIQSQSRGDPEQFIAWIAKKGGVGPYREWVETVVVLSALVHIDHAVILFQGDMATDGFKNRNWQLGRSMEFNAIELMDPVQRWQDNPMAGEDAATLHVATMYAVLGKTQFPKALRAAAMKIAPNWMYWVMDSVANEPERPEVVRIEDLGRRYRQRAGGMVGTWYTHMESVHKLVSRALGAPVQIPNQQYLHPVSIFPEPRIFKSTLDQPIYEGPHLRNRIVGSLGVGQQFRAYGVSSGYASRGNSSWYVLDGAVHGYVHAHNVSEV